MDYVLTLYACWQFKSKLMQHFSASVCLQTPAEGHQGEVSEMKLVEPFVLSVILAEADWLRMTF